MFSIAEIDVLTDEAIVREMTSTSRLADEEVCPYWVIDPMGRQYWFSPILNEAVVVQSKAGRC